ncbi:hypothetical protein NDU88_004356 [Pleurodeles waltl]|uniref:Myb/SANT-like DNA-binding domain-containing protein n=1 Tax=Pleurodeles waltl TaxID=8319 RepID=A0AAV7PH75_PLEWA|nr:hypothetical protein NDU88_004356 [Pleurodeles waltl]
MGCEVTALALYTVAVGSRRPLRNAALVNIGPYGSQEPMMKCAGGDDTHRRGRHRHGRHRHFLSVQSLDTCSSTGEDLHCMCCCDLGLEETMARASGERAPAFTTQELEKLVDGVLPQSTLLYGPPDQQVSAHQKKDIWRAIAKDVRTLGVHQRRSTHCRKRWEDIRHWSKKTAEAQLGMASQRGRGARRTMTPLMFRILAVAYPELDGRMRASQQTQGASSGGGTVAPEHKGAASHMAMEGHTMDSEYTSGTEDEGSFTAVTGSATSDTDSSSDGSSLVVAAPSRYVECTGHQVSQCDTEPKNSQPPPPVKHQKLDSARWERVKTPAGKAAHKGPGGSVESAVTPPKVGKGQKKAPKSGKSSTAEKAAIIPAAQDATASPIVTGQETTARVSAQEGSTIVTGQETTARVSVQEGPSSHSPLGNEGPPWHTPLHRSETAKSSTAEQGKDRHGKHR